MPASGILSPSDQALIAAIAAWAGLEEPAFLLRLGHQQARKLAETRRTMRPADPLATLKFTHIAQMAPDPARVHQTWFIRALKNESPSVLRSVVAAAEEPLRSVLMQELSVTPNELKTDHRPDPEVRQLALSLWTERLVGDLPTRDDDSPAIIALVNSSPISLYRLNRVLGLAKLSTLPSVDLSRFSERNKSRFETFRKRVHGTINPRLEILGGHDWSAAQTFGRHALAALGLTTLGRLLGQAEPYRLRWTLQHVPYSIAKRLRLSASQPQASVRTVIDWEARFLHEAFSLLRDEGRAQHEFDPDRSPTS